MQITYDKQHDILYISLRDVSGADAEEVCDGVVLDMGADGRPVGIEIDKASLLVDVESLGAWSVPVEVWTGPGPTA